MRIFVRNSFKPSFALALASLLAAPAIAAAQGMLSPAPLSGGGFQRLQPPAQSAPQAPAKPAPQVRSGPPGEQVRAPAPASRKAPAKRKKAAAANTGGGREMALQDEPTPTLQQETFYATAKASERYAAIADAGGWPKVPAAVPPGAHGKAVAILRQRLAMEGDLPRDAALGENWDEQLTAAVKKFQVRAGLRQSGAVTGKTLAAMNVPAAIRFRQLASSAQRIAGLQFAFGPRYVVVNIPSASVEAIENGRVVRRFVAVVGDRKHQSPEVTTRIVAVNLNPTWTVPTSIIKNEIAPKMLRDPGYLTRSRFKVLDRSGAEVNPASINWSSPNVVNYTVRQNSGRGNALGNIRINMPNNQAVYMHDTPSKRYFANDYRFLSHGCVRVQDVFAFAEWILQGTSGNWTKPSMLKRVAGDQRYDIRVNQPIPVAWIYMTAWASSDGVVHYRDDVYDRDRIGSARTAANN